MHVPWGIVIELRLYLYVCYKNYVKDGLAKTMDWSFMLVIDVQNICNSQLFIHSFSALLRASIRLHWVGLLNNLCNNLSTYIVRCINRPNAVKSLYSIV